MRPLKTCQIQEIEKSVLRTRYWRSIDAGDFKIPIHQAHYNALRLRMALPSGFEKDCHRAYKIQIIAGRL